MVSTKLEISLLEFARLKLVGASVMLVHQAYFSLYSHGVVFYYAQGIFLSKEIVQRGDTMWLKSSTWAKSDAATSRSEPDMYDENKYTYANETFSESSTASRFSSVDIEQHLISALLSPRGKLSTSQSLMPSSRFVSDFLAHKTLKPFRELKVIGFTLNLEHVSDAANIDWGRIMKAVPSCKVVVLLRSNIVKAALSGFTGQQNKIRGCDESNLRKDFNRSNTNCSPLGSTDWDIMSFSREVSFWQRRYKNFMASIYSNSPLKSRLVHTVYYEDLQVNQQNALTSMLTAIGLSPEESQEMAAEVCALLL